MKMFSPNVLLASDESIHDMSYLIIIYVMHISMFRNYSFNFRRNVAKPGRNMERHRERNIAERKIELS